MAIRAAIARRVGRRRALSAQAPVVPLDPIKTLQAPFDPALVQLRASLLPHRRRLWMRRLVRRGWIALAAVLVAELALWTIARFAPIEAVPMLGAAIPLVGLLGWLDRRGPRSTATR